MCLYVHKHSEVILQAFFRHYDIMIVEFFTFYYVQLDELDAVTSQNIITLWPHSSSGAQPSMKLREARSTQIISFTILLFSWSVYCDSTHVVSFTLTLKIYTQQK